MKDMLSGWYDVMVGNGNEFIYSKEDLYEFISPYHIDVVASPKTVPFLIIGGVLASLAVLTVLIVLFGKKFLLALAAGCLIVIVVFLVVNFDKIRTMASISEISDGLYYMNCSYDYECNKFLNADICTTDDMLKWIENELFYGISIKTDNANFGCSAFSATDENGNRLFGRNFDYDETDTLVIYSQPKNGYASYAVTDLKFFGIGTENGLDGNSLTSKAVMLAAHYIFYGRHK